MNKFQQSTPQAQSVPPPAPSYAEKSFLHTPGAAVVVPFWQSVAISVAVGLVALILSFRFGSYWSDALMNALTVTAITFLVSLLFLLRHWFFLTVERTFDIDIPGVGEEPQTPKGVTVTVNKVKGNGHLEQKKYNFSAATEEQVYLFCTKTRRMGKSISRREWTPKKTNGFSDDEWRTFWGELVKQTLITMDGGEYVLTEDGEDWADGVITTGDPTYSPAEKEVSRPENRRNPPTHPPSTHETGQKNPRGGGNG